MTGRERVWRVAHVDDHSVFREGLTTVLTRSVTPRFEVVASEPAIEALLKRLEDTVGRTRPDVLVLDLRLSGSLSGVAGVRACVATKIPVVVYANAIIDELPQCIAAGAATVLDKSVDGAFLTRALAEVCAGNTAYLSPGGAQAVSELVTLNLMPTATRVLELFAQGYTFGGIMSKLGFTRQTLRKHEREIRAELVRIGRLPEKASLAETERLLQRRPSPFRGNAQDKRRRRKADPA